MKKIIIAIVVLVIGGIAYYGISPLFNTIEVDDAVPVPIASESSTTDQEEQGVTSGFEDLSLEDQEDMLKQMEIANSEPTATMTDTMPNSQESAADSEDVENSSASVDVVAPVLHPVMGTSGHPAEGTVRIVETTEGLIARYENFSTINGPRLHVYLAKDLEGNDFIDLGPIRGTKGNINYQLPEGVDLTEYKYLMYWCVPFGVLFNYAEI